MTDNDNFDPTDIVVDGLAVTAETCGDPSAGKDGAGLYCDVKEQFDREIRPGDKAVIAFPCVSMEAREPALVLVLEDRAILAWSKGLFRPKVSIVTEPRSAVTDACIEPGSGSNRAATFLVVSFGDDRRWTLAMPGNRKDFWEQVRTLFASA